MSQLGYKKTSVLVPLAALYAESQNDRTIPACDMDVSKVPALLTYLSTDHPKSLTIYHYYNVCLELQSLKYLDTICFEVWMFFWTTVIDVCEGICSTCI